MIDFLNLPDSFVLAVVLVVLSLIALVIRLRQKGQSVVTPQKFVVIPLVAAAICVLYASITVVPQGKIAAVSDMQGNYNALLSQGLQVKLPWENAEIYNDVVIAEPFSDSHNAQISAEQDFIWSGLAEREVNGSYLLANACIRTFNDLTKAGQLVSDKFTCTFDDTSFLVLRE